MKIAFAFVVAASASGCGGAVERPPSDCPAPCAGDPIDEFSNSQGGTSGRWRYLADTRAANGATYEELTFGEVRGAPGWVSSTGSSPAGIVSCADNPDAQGCEGVETSLMFFPGTDSNPALAFVAAADGTYTVSGKARSATGNPEGLPQRFMLSRSSRHDLIESKVHVTSPEPDEFTVTVELLEGDRLILTFVGGMSESVPVTFDYHLVLVPDGPTAFPGGCELAATFDRSDPLADPCRSTLENLHDGSGPPGMSTSVPSVNADFGNAREFSEGQFLRAPGGPLPRTGDFTVQFWAKLAEPQHFADGVVFADWHNLASGGIHVAFGETSGVTLCSMWHGAASGTNCATGTRPLDGEWHFYRVTRSMEEAEIELCVDGARAINDANPATHDMTGDQPPYIARNVDFNPAYFNGTVDEVRAFTHALPCPTP